MGSRLLHSSSGAKGWRHLAPAGPWTGTWRRSAGPLSPLGGVRLPLKGTPPAGCEGELFYPPTTAAAQAIVSAWPGAAREGDGASAWEQIPTSEGPGGLVHGKARG